MTRSRRTDLLLLAVAVGLLVVWVVVPSSRSDSDLPSAYLGDLASDPPRSISIRRGASRLALKYQPDPSRIERYVTLGEHAAHTDPAVVDRLLLALGRLEVIRRVEASPKELGLDPPSLEIELQTRKGKRLLALGKPAAAPRNARYALITEGNEKHWLVLAASTVEAIDVEPNRLLDSRVFDLTPSELRELAWSTPDGPKQVTRTDDGHWRHGSARGARVRRSTLERFLSNLAELKLSRHLSPSVAAATLRNGSITELTLSVRRDERSNVFVLRVGGTCPGSDTALGLILEGERPVFGCVERRSYAALFPEASALIDDALFSLRTDEVERLVVANSTRNFALSRDGSEFQLDGSTKIKLPLATGNGLIESLVSMRGSPVGPCAMDARREQPLLMLDSYLIGDIKTVEQVRIGPIEPDGSRTICRDDGTELKLAAWFARQLELGEPLLRSPTLLDLPIDAVGEIRVGKDRSEPWLFRANARHQFALVQPQSAELAAVTVERFREQVASLHATRWLLPSEPKSFGAELSSLDVSVSLAEDTGDGGAPRQTRQRRLRVLLADGGDRAIGWLDRDPTPFLLDSEFAQVLNEIAKAMVAPPKL